MMSQESETVDFGDYRFGEFPALIEGSGCGAHPRPLVELLVGGFVLEGAVFEIGACAKRALACARHHRQPDVVVHRHFVKVL